MRVKDPKQIHKLLVIQQASRRDLAEAAGWQSHSIVNRLIHGQVKTVTPERAVRIARFFGVGVDDLFVPRLSTDAGQTSKRTAA